MHVHLYGRGSDIRVFGHRRRAPEDPARLAGGLVVGVVGSFANVSPSPNPILGYLMLLGYLVVEPLLAGGLPGMVDDAVTDETEFEDIREHATENYVDLLVARILLGWPCSCRRWW